MTFGPVQKGKESACNSIVVFLTLGPITRSLSVAFASRPGRASGHATVMETGPMRDVAATMLE